MCLEITNNVYINGELYNLESLIINNKNKIIKINDIIIYLKNINSKFNIYNDDDNDDNYFILYNNKLIENTVQFKYVSRDNSRYNTPVNISIFNIK